MIMKHFFRAVANKEEMPIDVYEACAMMCVTALSEQSIKNNGAPVEVPDFTDGNYKKQTDCRRVALSGNKIATAF